MIDAHAMSDGSGQYDVNYVFDNVLMENVAELTRCCENVDHPYHQAFEELMNVRNAEGFSPLDVASQFGFGEIVRLLLEKGAQVNAVNRNGYGALHRAVMWNQLAVCEQLYSAGCDVEGVTALGETPAALSKRYGHEQVSDFVEWARTRNQLVRAVLTLREQLDTVKLPRDDRNVALSACKLKDDWLLQTDYATTPTDHLLAQLRDFQDTVAPVTDKINLLLQAAVEKQQQQQQQQLELQNKAVDGKKK